MGVFDELPLPPEKAYLREEISKIDETWTAARFDSLPHVVHILTSKDREAAAQFLKEQSDVIEEVVDEVVQSYHSGFNRAIQNYSQILRLFSESTESIGVLKVDLAEAKKHLSARNKQLHQLWYRSVTLRHIISLLDQIEDIAKVPARIEKLIAEKQYYAAVQLHLQSIMMLERGLQTVGALQDVRSELTKLRGVLFYKILEDLHAHLYNKGEYSVAGSMMLENDDDVPTTTYVALTAHNSQSRSRRTKSLKGDNQTSLQIDGSFDGHDEEGTLDSSEEATLNGNMANTRVNGSDVTKDASGALRQMPTWLSNSTPDEFLEIIRKSDAPLHVKYLQTMVECLCMLGKVSAAGAMICQRLRPTIHETITSKIKAHADLLNSSRSSIGQGFQTVTSDLHFIKGQLESYQLPKQKRKNGISIAGTLLAVSPVSPLMAPGGKAQVAAKELLDSILDAAVRIFENHVVVGELLEAKVSLHADMNTPKSVPGDVSWNPDSETSQVTGGYSIGFSLTVLQSECQQLICEILRATPEAASADAAVQTARLANKTPSKEKRDGSENGLTFAFRFTDATISLPNQGVDIVRQGWNRKGPNVLQEGYGSAAVLPEEGIYLAASIYRPVLQFTDKIASMLPTKYSQLSNDGLLAFVENFVKDHFLPTMFVDYRKGVQQAISSPAAFRPRAHVVTTYTPSIEKGRPVLQGLLAIDYLTKEVLGWAQAMPKFANDLVNYVQTFLERTYERCRTSYMEAVLEKQSYMLIGRHDIEKLMRLDPSSAYLPNLQDPFNLESNSYDAETSEAELELSELLLNLRPIKQENLIHDENKLILLASLSDSLEYVADSIERLGQTTQRASNHIGGKHHSHSDSAPTRSLASFSQDYRKLAIDCLKVLRIEMQLETIFHMQEMTNTEYLDDQDAEEPDDFVISLTAQITRRDEEMAPFISNAKRNYIFGGICGVAANVSVKALAAMKSINLFGVQQICRNSIALEQCVSRTAEMLDDALGLMGLKDHEGNRFLHPPCAEYICARKCAAPYVIQNLTSVPLLYHVYNGHINPNDIYDPDLSHAKYVQPGSASTIYMDENDEQQHYSPYHSSERLNEQRPSGLAHRYITVQLEGTYMLSDPISMDLVGLTCFNANFSKSYNENDDDGRMNTAPTFVVPVVLDVSALRYSKSIRIYSTVVLLNATSAPLELRFDIPFGVSPMIFDPIHPGQQFPLPLHLAEAGCVRWRPMGNSYLWSEAHKLSNLLSVNSKVGNFKSFICYPSHPSSHPFRCCLSVKSISLTSSGWLKNNHSVNDAKKHYIHHLILSAPLVINNFLPKEILLISESGGLNHTVRVSEVETSIYHIDPSHDLGLEICIDGFKCCDFKFPRLETFCTMAKLSATKFSISETLIFEPNNSNGHISVTVEKVMDAYSEFWRDLGRKVL